jgi:chaperonin GroEL
MRRYLITDKKDFERARDLARAPKGCGVGQKRSGDYCRRCRRRGAHHLCAQQTAGTFNVLAVKAPGYGDRKKEMLEDIAVMTGGQVISEKTGKSLRTRRSTCLAAQQSDRYQRLNGDCGRQGRKKDIDARVAQIRKQIEDTTSKFDKEKLKERLAKLSGGVAVIRVGAATETEMKYLKLKIEDAVNATKAAIEEGIVAGGGTALVKARKKFLRHLKKIKKKCSRHARGLRGGALAALEMPLRQIAENAGYDPGVRDESDRGKRQRWLRRVKRRSRCRHDRRRYC